MNTDSGREYDWNGTEAISPWNLFEPNVYGSPGQARTYYGSKYYSCVAFRTTLF